MKRLLPLTGATLLIAACASAPPPGPDVRTMKSLDQQPTVVLREVAPSDRQLALRSYQAYVRAAESPERRMQALRRIADIRLAIAEEAVVSGGEGPPDFAAAIEAYRDLLRANPDYPAADEVHYQIARAYDGAGDDMRSLEALTLLARDYPGSALYTEAQFRRGELLFAGGDYAGAERAYREVTESGERSSFYEQALYKRGWSLYRQSRLDAALQDFTRVLERSLLSESDFRTWLGPEALPRAQRELVDDTLRVISLSLARMGGAEAASAWFAGRPPLPFEHLIYSALAEHYRDRDMHEEAAHTLAAFIGRNPGHEQAPLFQIRIAEVFAQAGLAARAQAAREGFIRDYGPDSPYWKGRELSRMPQVAQRLKQELFTMAQRAHAAAQASGSEADYAAAARWYRDYLGLFPDDDRAPELAFLLGELLFESGRYAEAIEHYEQSAYRYSPHARAAEAGYAALLAYERHIAQLEGEEERRIWRVRSIEASTRFTTQFPRHPQVATVLARTAEHLFATGQHSRALTLALRVTGTSLRAEPALQRAAWVVVGDVQFERKDFAQAEAAYAGALGLHVPDVEQDSTGGFDREAVVERLAASIYKQGEAARDAGATEDAVRHFGRVASSAPGSPIAESADYDVAAIAFAAGDWPVAIARLEAFRRAWPQSRWQDDVGRQLAHAYIKDGQLARAADELGRIAAKNADPEQAREALWQSAALYARAGDMTRATLAWQRYIVAWPRPVDRAIEARRRIAEAFQTTGDGDARERWLREIMAAHEDAGSEGSDFSRQAAAEAALELAAPLREQYLGIALTMPLERSLRAKRQAMEAALEAYTQAAGYGIAGVTTAATFRIGEFYHHFSRALLASERPPDLSADELEEYDVLLEEQAYPFEEEAIKLYEVNYRRIAQGFYDQWVRASLEQLAVLMPVRYGKTEKRIEVVEAIH